MSSRLGPGRLAWDPVKLTVTGNPGAQYRVVSIDILGPDGKAIAVPPDPEAPLLPLKPGDPARTEPIIATENALLGVLGHAGYAFAKKLERRVVVDHDTQTVAITYALEPGPKMRFGQTAIAGLERLDPSYVEPVRQLGLLYYQERDVAKARWAFERYLTLAPDAADARRIREYLSVVGEHRP